MPARSGDCTNVRNRVSRSWGSTVRGAAGAVARRALKIRSSIYLVWLSADGGGNLFRGEGLELRGRLGERRGGEEGRSRGAADHLKKKKKRRREERGIGKKH